MHKSTQSLPALLLLFILRASRRRPGDASEGGIDMQTTAAPPWALILAGGDGTRLRALTRQITGDPRPKQFCPLLDG
jgi:hypothetical protein